VLQTERRALRNNLLEIEESFKLFAKGLLHFSFGPFFQLLLLNTEKMKGRAHHIFLFRTYLLISNPTLAGRFAELPKHLPTASYHLSTGSLIVDAP
jgi:hypothetical protein